MDQSTGSAPSQRQHTSVVLCASFVPILQRRARAGISPDFPYLFPDIEVVSHYMAKMINRLQKKEFTINLMIDM